ncbi:MAG: hypothetical protein A2086_13225 [Spirochaetes bacterium GWD1_27_9]|nr:MAG: hypothetical protein A2Z98_02215 [Spirochaetes bacterium GWB1_27_13]OHD25923.1 MAG: hypothetical protein A2Y34_14230 [Spirochaetes bacterium GWC1_27_15]OHD44886.1 MAG: hypothetical protein A2086_13225 [Spirochaetes bacterium GWD1_27_9]
MKNLKKILRNIFGVICLIIGVIGGFIPFLQGWIFVLIGFLLLDFAKKEEWEAKVLKFLKKTKLGHKLATLWENIKHKHKKTIEEKDNSSIKDMYKQLKEEKK